MKAVQKPVADDDRQEGVSGEARREGRRALQKTKHVAAVKHQTPAHHATVGKPIPLTKHQPPAKGAAPAQPVLPRV